MQDIRTIINDLHLEPHPEGGFYKEMHRSEIAVKDLKGSSNKSAHTSIYYLLSGKDFSLGTELNRMKLGTFILAVMCSFIFLMKINCYTLYKWGWHQKICRLPFLPILGSQQSR